MLKVTDKSGGEAPSGPAGQARDGVVRCCREFRRSSLERAASTRGPVTMPRLCRALRNTQSRSVCVPEPRPGGAGGWSQEGHTQLRPRRMLMGPELHGRSGGLVQGDGPTVAALPYRVPGTTRRLLADFSASFQQAHPRSSGPILSRPEQRPPPHHECRAPGQAGV